MSAKSDTLGITKNGFYSIASKNFSSWDNAKKIFCFQSF